MGPFDHLTPGQREQFREANAQRKIAAADLASGMDRGTCPVCGGDYQLTKRGLLRRHEQFRRDCPGGGQKPKEG